ncbi:MAG: thioredoxin domain-containing protein [Candidatus Saccharimonadales bacterium]
MDRTRWIIFIVIAVVTLGGLVLLTRQEKVDVANIDPSKAVSETETAIGDQIYGNKSSEVVLIEYGDFQCPGCEGAFPQLKTIKEEYKEQIAFIFRNFPITTSHPNALAASTAAEAAGLQGKFWEMHDKLYENQNAWGTVDASKRTAVFTGYAKDLGLDTGKFTTDLKDPRVSAKIRRDQAFGRKLGVDSTPTIYLGSEKLTTEETSDLIQSNGDLLRKKIDAALKKAGVQAAVQE